MNDMLISYARRKIGIKMNAPRVLVLDDSPSTCLFLATTLQQAGYEAEIALTAQEGLAKIMTFHPQCLILDVLLPGTNGYALCRQIRLSPIGKTLPLILISSKGTPLDVNYGLRQGADRYLPKPFTAEALVQAVREIIPEPFRQTVASQGSFTVQQSPRPELFELVPRRAVSQDAMQTSNPFAQASVRRNEQVRRLYAAIDGRKTVRDLASVTGLKTEEVIRALRLLLKERSIRIYTATGQFLERPL
jgi:chemotaxis family two-component system response regulator PixH